MAIAAESHPFPSRTRKLSPPAPMVLGGIPPGRVGRRRNIRETEPRPFGAGLCRVRPVAWRVVPSPPSRHSLRWERPRTETNRRRTAGLVAAGQGGERAAETAGRPAALRAGRPAVDQAGPAAIAPTGSRRDGSSSRDRQSRQCAQGPIPSRHREPASSGPRDRGPARPPGFGRPSSQLPQRRLPARCFNRRSIRWPARTRVVLPGPRRPPIRPGWRRARSPQWGS